MQVLKTSYTPYFQFKMFNFQTAFFYYRIVDVLLFLLTKLLSYGIENIEPFLLR